MDEMKLKLSTKFMRGLIAKIISKLIQKKLGYKVNILINEITLRSDGEKIYIHTNVDGETTKEEFTKLIKQVGLD